MTSFHKKNHERGALSSCNPPYHSLSFGTMYIQQHSKTITRTKYGSMFQNQVFVVSTHTCDASASGAAPALGSALHCKKVQISINS